MYRAVRSFAGVFAEMPTTGRPWTRHLGDLGTKDVRERLIQKGRNLDFLQLLGYMIFLVQSALMVNGSKDGNKWRPLLLQRHQASSPKVTLLFRWCPPVVVRLWRCPLVVLWCCCRPPELLPMTTEGRVGVAGVTTTCCPFLLPLGLLLQHRVIYLQKLEPPCHLDP